MDEIKNNSQEGMKGGKCEMCGRAPMCGCGCGCGWAHGHRAFRIILRIIIALVIFWVGVKVGEVGVALQLHSNGGFRGGYSNTYNPGGPMMRVGGGEAVPVNGTATSSVPAQQ
jgi:hypothetical protein